MKVTPNHYLVVLCFFMLCFCARAQQIERPVAVSAYIYNFAKQIEWPNEASLKEFHFRIIGQDKALLQALNTLSMSKQLKGKQIRVSSSTTLNELETVQLIIVPKSNGANLVDIFDEIEGKEVLLVSDNYQDKRLIMINFYDSNEGTLLFEINKANIINQRLSIMEDMILLGGTEIDVATLYQEGQQSLRSLQKRNETLVQNQSKLEASLKQLESTISVINREVEKNKDSLRWQAVKLIDQQMMLGSQSLSLQQREQQMELQLAKIQEIQQTYRLQSQELNAQTLELSKGKETLARQQQTIKRQNEAIKSQSDILQAQGMTIHRQRILVFLLGIIFVLVVILIIVKARTHNLNKLNLSLETRVAERTAQLVEINKELESFSYSISHDLRAPLRAIFGFSQILSSRHRNSLNGEGRQYMDYIVEASIRMEQLINDLLSYSRLGRKSLEMRPISLGEIIENIHTDFRQKLEEIGATFKTDEAFPVISGDESLLRQIFTNLIDNAISYRRTDVPLIIGIHCKHDTNSYAVSVSDNGIGIPQEHWEKIFNIFQRLHSEDEYRGTGIGLATVKKAVSMLDGTVRVESIVGKGSIFIIHLPESKTLTS